MDVCMYVSVYLCICLQHLDLLVLIYFDSLVLYCMPIDVLDVFLRLV